ncbi:MAG: S41 family peptidase [Chthoniobacterales bacterium]
MLRLVLSVSLTIALFLALPVTGQTPPRPTPSPSTAASAAAATASPGANTVDGLDAVDLRRAIPLIQDHYVNPAAVSGAELNRATLEGLLTRFGPGVRLLPARPAVTPTPAPFYREIINGRIGYLRPGDLSRSQIGELDTTLRGFASKNVDAIILDLRGCVETNDYAAAAEFASRFVPKNKPLFSLRGQEAASVREFSSKQDPLYSGFLVVLVDGETAGATEVVAGVLRHYDKTIVIGQTTAGQALDYADLPLPSGKILRIAVAEAILPDQRPRFPDGVEPDLPVALSPEEKHDIFQQSLTKGMAPFVFEADRPHFNEAALLAGTNPEIDAVQAAQQRRARGGEKPALHDTVLQRAIDLVTSIEVYEKQPGRPP